MTHVIAFLYATVLVKFSYHNKGTQEIFRSDRHVNDLIVVMASHVCVQTPQTVYIRYVKSFIIITLQKQI